MKFVGLDLSLTAIGYCHPDGSTCTVSSKLKGISRIVDLRRQVADLLQFDDPTLVLLEEYAFSRGGHAHELGELGGVIKIDVLLPNFAYALVPIGTLKKFASSLGNCDKTKMAVAASKLGREFPNSDECDAWWLREMALYRFESPDCVAPKTAYRDECVGKIDWPALVAP